MERRLRGGLSFAGEIAAAFLDFAHSQAENQSTDSYVVKLIYF
ncbi:hypothetical protein NC651_032008 [Populus alba x Populus x berolinensis]|nr:hypothetical protein NC651_032008 [Populus alba x Populus x berolinensis]